MSSLSDVYFDSFKLDKPIDSKNYSKKQIIDFDKDGFKKDRRQKKKTQKKARRFSRPVDYFEYSQSVDQLDDIEEQIDLIILNNRLEKIESEFKSRVPTIIKYCANQIFWCSAIDRNILYRHLVARCCYCIEDSYIACDYCCDFDWNKYCNKDLKKNIYMLATELKKNINFKSSLFWTMDNNLPSIATYNSYIKNLLVDDYYYEDIYYYGINLNYLIFWNNDNWLKIKRKSLIIKLRNYVILRVISFYWLEQSQRRFYQLNGRQRILDRQRFINEFPPSNQ